MGGYRGQQAIGTVAAIGGGVIGGGWVAAFLGSGRAVRLHDPAPVPMPGPAPMSPRPGRRWQRWDWPPPTMTGRGG
ncbi:hypothetical protein ACFSTI_25655 [Rhizorhabdus histidinilytica]